MIFVSHFWGKIVVYIFRQRVAISTISHFVAGLAAFPITQLAGRKRWLLALIFSFFSVLWAGAASAQVVTSSSASPSTYTGAGENIVFTIKFNTGNSTLGSASVTSGLSAPISYTCTPQTSGSIGAAVTCSGTYTTTGSDSGQIVEVATVDFTSGSGTPTTLSQTPVILVNQIVADTQAPVVTVPTDITVGNDAGQTSAVVSFTPTATDNVGVTSLVSSPASGSTFALGTTTVTVTATDAAGNTDSDTFTVTVNDTQNPVATVPADIIVGNDTGQASAVVSFTPSATDNVGVTSLVSSPASGSTFAVGTTTVTVTATDAAGNTDSDTFTVTVNDTQNPVATVPADITVGNDTGQASAVVNFTPTATDNVGVTSLVSSPASGSTFALGTTTVTVTATDAASNTGSDTFTVTVEDVEAPVFTSSQADINIEIDFNQTSAVVTFPSPTASDNSGGVTVTQTGGISSGGSFPVGPTLVEFTASDGAGLSVKLQFTVTVALIPPGTVTFVVNSPDDGTVNFTSGTPAFNTAVVVSAGSGTSGLLKVVPGNYSASYTLPAGFAVTSGSCSSASGTVDIGAKALTMAFARGETYVCTLQTLDIAERTGTQIQNFMDNRGRQIMGNRPGQNRRIARVGGNSNSNRVSFFGNTVNRGPSPIGLEVTQNQVDLSFASSSASEDQMTAQSDWDLWLEASFSWYETSYGEGQFGILHAGADYRLGQKAILGFGVQVDSVQEDVIGSTATTEGVGWMVGPYYTARIGDGLYIDTSLSYGQATNEVSPLGTYTDEFMSERWLATLGLFGSIDRDTLNIQPNVSINYFQETSEAYVDSLAVPIAARTTRLGDIELGSRLTWSDPRGQYSNYIEFHGIYTFEASSETASMSTAETGMRGRIGFGGVTAVGDSSTVEYGARYDGLGDDDYEAVSLSIGYSMSF
jgi:HYR domain/Autotransporter beta-domain